MNIYSDGQDFPRKLSEIEKYWLDLILPEDRPGYNYYRNQINNMYVIGYGQFPPFNLILGNKEDLPDLSNPTQSLIATGKFFYKQGNVSVSIYAETEQQVEIDIYPEGFVYTGYSPSDLIHKEISWFTYSNWLPGQKHPLDNSDLRIIQVLKDKFDLVFSPLHKRVWIYEYDSKFIRFIPITNFYQELLKVKKINDINLIANINSLFTNLDKFSDQHITEAFINYNRYWKKIDIKSEIKTKPKEKNFFSKILRGFYGTNNLHWKRSY